MGLLLAVIISSMALVAQGAKAEEEEADPAGSGPLFDEFMGALKGSKPILDLNLRWEYAKIDTFTTSQAVTVRTRFGLATGEFYGFSGLLEGVNMSSPKPSAYYDGVEPQTSQSIVADPERTDVNRAWLKYEDPDCAGLALKGGRQRIILDDQRWVGNVAWRQNEQTFDSGRIQSDFGVENLLAMYAYSWEVNRIWADDPDAAPANKDFDPRSHFFHVGYEVGKPLTAVAFAYLIDPDDSAVDVFGSQTYGARFTGALPLGEKVSFPYQLSYAHQSDWGDNPVSYDADYYFVQGGFAFTDVGGVHVGFEVLGSDRDARVVTPFATAHKFNGFADAFLDNGGVRGLRDLFVSLSPAIPIDGVKLSLIFHQFWDDQGGDNLGQEYDFVATWALNEYISFLWKAAYFDGGKNRSPGSRTRNMVQTIFKF